MRVLREGQVQERAVTVGLYTRMQAQVTSGLAAGDEVILDGASPRAKGKGNGRGKDGRGKSDGAG